MATTYGESIGMHAARVHEQADYLQQYVPGGCCDDSLLLCGCTSVYTYIYIQRGRFPFSVQSTQQVVCCQSTIQQQSLPAGTSPRKFGSFLFLTELLLPLL